MKKIIDELINSSISGADVYRYKNATWLIFTDEGKWVVELTDDGTLWYNYKFFNDIFKYVSMTVGKEMEEYVIQWANDYFYKDCAHRSITYPRDTNRNEIPKIIKNGIKEVYDSSSTHRQMRAQNLIPRIVKDVKEIKPSRLTSISGVNYNDVLCKANTIEIGWIVRDGIKNIYTASCDGLNEFESDKVIEDGVKL